MTTKILITLGVIFLFCYPFVKLKGKLRWLSFPSSLTYQSPKNRRNIYFVFLTVVEFICVSFIIGFFENIAKFVYNIPFLGKLFSNVVNSVNSQIDYIVFAVRLVIVNLLILYLYFIAKAILKHLFINPSYIFTDFKAYLKERKKKKAAKKVAKKAKRNAKKSKNKGNDGKVPSKFENNDTVDAEEKMRKRRRIPDFLHKNADDSDDKKKKSDETEKDSQPDEKRKQYGKISKFVLGLFFEGEEFQYAKPWVIRARNILQVFIRLIQAVYLLFVIVLVASVFWDLPMPIYNILIDVLNIRNWYIYPVISMLFLQEICNVFDTTGKEFKTPDQKREEDEKKQDKKRDAKIRALLAELKKRFDAEHTLRCYPEVESEEIPEYVCTNVMYASALKYIRTQMKESSGRVVQSYMKFLDAIYNDSNVYFSASFYSELGEYLIAYTYIRLLSGARQIFVVSDASEKDTLRKYISDRLMRMTGSSEGAGWRIYTADERLDQADVLIASPEDFLNIDIVDQYPSFFEEACNAVFIDADKTISISSYMCPIIATKLQNITGGRIRFIFLSLGLLKGFAAGSLPRFFCIDSVLSFSSARENEAVSYVLWNKESKKHRIYNKSGQGRTCLETIIAEQAFSYGIDGVRLITESPLEHAERKILSMHDVEINNLYKNIVDVNYMIYSDDRCNLSAALYACTRFRGKKKSVVHILSKPYLLREYFMSKAVTEDFINRSSFIQPRVTEHAERYKLSLVRIFCDATFDKGLSVAEFEKRMRNVIIATKERGDIITSAFCRHIIENREVYSLKLNELAAFLIAGLYDNDFAKMDNIKNNERANGIVHEDTPKARELEEQRLYDECRRTSVGNRAKDFYIVSEPTGQGKYSSAKEKYISFNRVKEVFAHLLECNKRVELRLNDKTIGLLDTFPSRVHLEYTEGQTIIFDNSEYEIEHIPEDGSAVYLRQENISIKNCLDTVLLRNYTIKSLIPMEKSTAVLNNSKSVLEEIRVTKCRAVFDAVTYGFYSLTSDRQTLDFYHGVEGNPHIDNPNARHYSNSRVLKISLKTRKESNDGMRLLLTAVFNEFIKTIFPDAYHCVAICPVLENPLSLDAENIYEPIGRIKTLYPFISNPSEEFVETDKCMMQFMFINDCKEDIGVLDWFYDRSGRYMQEFLTNIYSYLHWLKICPEKNHFIYFGGKELPECYDLEGCCEILSDFNLILSDDGKKDIETAGDDTFTEEIEYCAFCHKVMESGRFEFFDKKRFICADCFDVVSEDEQLESLYLKVRKYLSKNYPEITFGKANVKLDGLYSLGSDQILSEYYSRVDFTNKTIYVEKDEPINNVCVSILRGLIILWQVESSLSNHYASAQLYYEELCYLRSIGQNESAEWIYNNVPDHIRAGIDEIIDYIARKGIYSEEKKDVNDVDESEENGGSVEDEIQPNAPADDGFEGEFDENNSDDTAKEKKLEPIIYDDDHRTSFTFIRIKADEDKIEIPDDPTDEDYSDGLYNPKMIPRFWKRYLRGEHIDDGKEEDVGGGDNNGDNYDDDTDKNASDEDISFNDVSDNDEVAEDDNADEGSTDLDDIDEEIYIDEDDITPSSPSLGDEGLFEGTGEGIGEGTEEVKTSDDSSKDKKDNSEMKAEKLRKKEEKKRQKEEKRKQRLEKWQKSFDERDEKKAKEKAELFGKGLDDKKKKPVDNLENNGDIGDIPVVVDDTKGSDENKGNTDKKKDKSEKKTQKDKKQKLSLGERECPYEEDEKTNPKIRLYNNIVRAAYNYYEGNIPRDGVADSEILNILLYVTYDYPQLFWLSHGCSYSSTHITLKYRCKDANGHLDIAQIEKKRKALEKGAKYFTKGITKKTDPYKALLKIYRRVILTFDYDTVGLNARVGIDQSRDDQLRSLYNAIINHKVVCAGYAAAMQYLMQSVGIVCGYVVSEDAPDGVCHAFNILKLGKYCYYLDATWGDMSATDHDKNKDDVSYDYFCVPYSDFIKAQPKQVANHMPRKEHYPDLEKFQYTNHEYYRYHKAYLNSYNESEIIRIFAQAALKYDKDEMGNFTVGMRCSNVGVATHIYGMLSSKGKIFDVIAFARSMVAKKDKKAAKLLDSESVSSMFNKNTGVITYYFIYAKNKKDKKKK